jgi:cyclopropane fatty-acyl-phospholipid synthase-like methyltransferase
MAGIDLLRIYSRATDGRGRVKDIDFFRRFAFPNKLAHSRDETRESCRKAETTIKPATARKHDFNLTKQKVDEHLNQQYHKQLNQRTYEMNLVEMTPTETAMFTIIRGRVIREQRESDGM